MFAAEARGLEFLRQAGALRIPEVLAVSPADEGPSFLLLEFIRGALPAARVRRTARPRAREFAPLRRAELRFQ